MRMVAESHLGHVCLTGLLCCPSAVMGSLMSLMHTSFTICRIKETRFVGMPGALIRFFLYIFDIPLRQQSGKNGDEIDLSKSDF